MKVTVGVGVFVFKDGKFLMGKRKGSHGKDTWSVPGGWIEFGESFEETSVREVFEETTLKVKNVKFIGVTNNVFLDEGIHSVTVWTVSDYKSGTPKISEPDKFIDQKWFTFKTLPEPLFLPWKELLAADFVDTIKSLCK